MKLKNIKDNMLPELIKLNTDPAVVTSKTGYVVACEKEGNFYVCIHGGISSSSSLFPVSNKIVWEMFGLARAIKSEV